ncbi:MAG: hypothetical protein EBR15_06880 [Gammaproteobacteria bacterium]|nr:hypothetical protein [Gammaproteobacteria bacterium]
MRCVAGECPDDAGGEKHFAEGRSYIIIASVSEQKSSMPRVLCTAEAPARRRIAPHPAMPQAPNSQCVQNRGQDKASSIDPGPIQCPMPTIRLS